MSAGKAIYRVREEVVLVLGGYRDRHERRFLAERILWIFWLFPIWSPVRDGAWRRSSAEARRDAEHDAWLRGRRSDPVYFEL